MAQLAIKNLSKLAPFAGGPWNLPHKFHLYLLIILLLKKKTSWHPFVGYSNGWAVQYSNGINEYDYLASYLILSIWIPNEFGIQISTVLKKKLYKILFAF